MSNYIYCIRELSDDYTKYIFYNTNQDILGMLFIEKNSGLVTTCYWGGYGIEHDLNVGEIYINDEAYGTLEENMDIIELITGSIHSCNYDFMINDLEKTYLPHNFSLKYQVNYIINEMIFKEKLTEPYDPVYYCSNSSLYENYNLCFKYDNNTYLVRNRYAIIGCYLTTESEVVCEYFNPKNGIEDYSLVTNYESSNNIVDHLKPILDHNVYLIPNKVNTNKKA